MEVEDGWRIDGRWDEVSLGWGVGETGTSGKGQLHTIGGIS